MKTEDPKWGNLSRAAEAGMEEEARKRSEGRRERQKPKRRQKERIGTFYRSDLCGTQGGENGESFAEHGRSLESPQRERYSEFKSIYDR